jgi:tRNA-specific 2-thiouridylase
VAQKDPGSNALIVVQGHDHPLLMKNSLHAEDASWIGGEPPAEGSAHTAKTRYRQADSPCIVTRAEDAEIAVEFARVTMPTTDRFASAAR